jgi:tetratricopeptide (TPR) repeat protein
VKLAPKNNTVAGPLGRAYLAADSVDKAVQELTRAKETAPDDPTIYDALGDAFLKQNVVTMAIDNYQRSVELDPTNTARRLKLARVYEKDRKYTDAVKQVDEIIKLDSTNADAYYQKGNILVRAKMFKQSIPTLQKFTQLRPKDVVGSVFFVKALSGAGEDAEAVKEAKRSLKMDSTNIDVWRILAQSQVAIDSNEAAIVSFETMKRRKGFLPEDESPYGTALYKAKRYDDALKALTAAVATDTTNCDAYYTLGMIYMSTLRDYAKAAEMFDKRIACDPRLHMGAYMNAAASHMAVKNFARARVLLTAVVEKRPDYPRARLYLARYFVQVDSLELAKAEYDSVLKQASNDERYKKEVAEAHFQTGMYYFTKQQYAAAVESYRKAAAYGADDAALRLNWGIAVMQTLDPTGSQADNNKKVEESIKHFRRVIEKEPGNAQGHLWLAQGLIRSRVEGDDAKNREIKEEACSELRKVLKIDPRNDDAKKTMERVGCTAAK